MSEYESFPLKSFNIDSANANSHPREVKIAKKKTAYHSSLNAFTV